jgi:hypothetical protein
MLISHLQFNPFLFTFLFINPSYYYATTLQHIAPYKLKAPSGIINFFSLFAPPKMLSTPPMLVILLLKQMMRDVDHDEDDAGREDHSHVTN